MKYIKPLFLLALFNYLTIGAVVLALKQSPPPLPLPMVTPSPIPTTTPSPPPLKKTTLKSNPDPFSVVFNSAPSPTTSQNQSAPTSPPAAAPTTDSRCLISVDGQRYDVTSFRNTHSGGNIFQCGADMSATFHNQHPLSFLDKLARYRI